MSKVICFPDQYQLTNGATVKFFEFFRLG